MKEAEAKDDEEKYKEERRREYLFTTKLDPAIMVVRYQEVAETEFITETFLPNHGGGSWNLTSYGKIRLKTDRSCSYHFQPYRRQRFKCHIDTTANYM